MANNTRYLFWPNPIGPYENDLQLLVTELVLQKNHADWLQSAIQNPPSYPASEEYELRYITFLHVLLDLLRQEWQPFVEQGRLYVGPPKWAEKARGADDIAKHKDAVRRSLSWERDKQFQSPSVKAFIRKMETERFFKGQPLSIRSLIADGAVLSKKLEELTCLDETAQRSRVMTVIQPYLQLVTADTRCKHTNLRLMDVWRYFRYQWQTPYNATPGRQMFYLVRDRSLPFHPVIGIAALGSSLVQLTVRDDEIGWTKEAIDARLTDPTLAKANAAKIGSMLKQTLISGLADIDLSDLITKEELENPTSQLVLRLQSMESESRVERIDWLQKKNVSERQSQLQTEQQTLPFLDFAVDSSLPSAEVCTERATTALYRAKRARVLWELLGAKIVLDQFGEAINTPEGLQQLWRDKEGNRTIRTLVRTNKKRKVGINLMDIIVCGAVQPYNTLLGGKLIAMLLAGPQIVYEYAEKYNAHASNIASQLKGEEVFRQPDLVFLGTTSLYGSSSVQYNRIAIPVKGKERVRFRKYGLTRGYGSVHFAAETRAKLAELLHHTNQARLINNRFGEGVNPKLRRVSAGLSALGLSNVENFTRHHSQRIVYGVELCRNSFTFLRGEDLDPDYYFNVTNKEAIEEQMHSIASYWARRWLLPRIQNSSHITTVHQFNKASTLLSNTEQI
ncbi:MAG: DUF4338 domain-containing protein [Anaerolineae bacterium]|nr:DUF4338 domain-containing protein [Anaerolineae bacterium]